MKQLPIGISTFRDIKEKNCYYADKTEYIKLLADQGKYYFLSRPRRFGKSLFVDTLKEAFTGNKELFKGLYLEKKITKQKIKLHKNIKIKISGAAYQKLKKVMSKKV